MRRVAALVAVSLLTACATPAPSGPDAPTPHADSDDCAVIAAIAIGHYRFNDTDNRPLPIRFEGDYAPRCQWSRYGLAFQAYDPDAPGDPRQRMRWVSFARPVYGANHAVIETGIMHGPLAGMGYECRVEYSDFAGWALLGECRNTWVS